MTSDFQYINVHRIFLFFNKSAIIAFHIENRERRCKSTFVYANVLLQLAFIIFSTTLFIPSHTSVSICLGIKS